MYGLPKILKNVSDPPLRPIISMVGTVTHSLAQHLNAVIRPFIDDKFIVKSTDEFLAILQGITLSPGQEVVSLDVASLFSNVPVEATIELIAERAYNHPTLPPPILNRDDLCYLLKICTKETPFLFKGQNYLQRDGVSMGSPLGPTFADFYMANLENSLLSQNLISNPLKYLRYVDDTFCIFRSRSHVHHFIRRLKLNSVLDFTFENMVDSKFNFLDVKITLRADGRFDTSVYIKPTDKGCYANFNSHTPLQYKRSVINCLVNHAIKYSSSWWHAILSCVA